MNRIFLCLTLGVILLISGTLQATSVKMIINEYNCVGPEKYLEGYVYSDLHNGILVDDEYLRTYPGMPTDPDNPALGDGRIQGNLDDWMELVVLEDHLDIRGWKIKWAETLKNDTNGTDIWYGNPSVEQGIIIFSNSEMWSDLRAGTIITIAEKHDIEIDTDWDSSIPPNRNFTVGVPDEEADVIVDLHSDLSYSPQTGDWWIHIGTRDEIELENPKVTTITNVTGQLPGDFSVGNDNWQCIIEDASGNLIFGPLGEACPNWGGSGINSREMGKLETDPIPGQTNAWYMNRFNDGSSSTFGLPNLWDASTSPKVQHFGRLRSWALKIENIKRAGSAIEIDWNDDVILGAIRNNQMPNYIENYGLDNYIVEWSTDMINWHQIPVGSQGKWQDSDTAGFTIKYYRIRIE